MTHTTPEHAAARQMCDFAHLSPTDAELNVLAADIAGLAADITAVSNEGPASIADATRVLLRRIGGYANVRAYLDSLMAGHTKGSGNYR